MRFSEVFNIRLNTRPEWLDIFLSLDSRVFIDPFLIYDFDKSDKASNQHFDGSHDEIIGFFAHCFRLIARSSGNTRSTPWRRAENLLMFPEVEELCLGYTSEGTGGLGSGKDIAKRISNALWRAVSLGLTELRHFEEIQIFETGIGPDRISDATAGILRHRFAAYTEEICLGYGVETEEVRFGKSWFDHDEQRWISGTYQLPINPYNSKPILLTPKYFVRSLPTINADDFYNYCFDNEAEVLRERFGDDIARRVPKEEIVEIARNHPDVQSEYVSWREQRGTEPYDFANDPAGFFEWYERTKQYISDNPTTATFSSPESFFTFVDDLIGEFGNYVENNGGWSLLWNENRTPKREEASQFLFLGIVKHYCKANNIDISREVNIGRGPVDFKVSSGYSRRCLVEVKLAKNTRFWHGLERQLPKYMQAEGVDFGRFLVIVLGENDFERIADIRERTRALSDRLSYDIEALIVDAQIDPPSASRL